MTGLSQNQASRIKLAIQVLEPYRRAVRYCSACGTCTSNCPVYKLTRNEKDTGRGHVRMVEWWLANLQTSKNWPELIKSAQQVRTGLACCLRCYNCHSDCPSGLEIIATLEAARQSVNIILPELDVVTFGFRVYGRLFKLFNPLVNQTAKILRPLMFKFNTSKLVLLNFLSGISYLHYSRIKSGYRFPKSGRVLNANSFKGKVAYFHDCMSDLLHPDLKRIAVRELEHLGYKVEVLKNTICCGAPFVAKGDYFALKAHAEHNHRILSQIKENYDFIVFSNPTCAKTVQLVYEHVLNHPIDYQNQITMDWRLIIDEKLKNRTQIQDNQEVKLQIAYHDACHLRNYSNEGEKMRALCRMCGNYQARLGEQNCCGFGGLFNFQYTKLARQLNAKRIATIPYETEILVNANPACTMFLAVGLCSRAIEPPSWPMVLHPVELWALCRSKNLI